VQFIPRAHTLLLLANVAYVATLLGLLWQFLLERSRVRTFALSATRGAQNASETARILARVIHTSIVRRDDDPPFLHRSLAVIGASPSAVMRHGACCSGIARLYILALDSLGIPAAQVTLYHASGEAQHCLVEVVVDGVGQLIDPTYGVAFESRDARPLSLADVQAGQQPCLISIRDGGQSGYPPNDYYRFDYAQTKTANWTRAWPRRSAYAVLRHVMDIDRLRVPVALEWPHVIVGCLVIFGAIGMNGLAQFL
jgi:transglutaminase superfamily protein